MEHHVGIAIKDLKRMVHFYQDILGFIIMDLGFWEGEEAAAPFGMSNIKYKILRVIPPQGDFFIQFLQFEDAEDQELQTRAHTSLGLNHVGIEVDDIDAIYLRLKRHNIKTESAPILQKKSGVKLLNVRDPEGNTIEFLQFPLARKKELAEELKKIRQEHC